MTDSRDKLPPGIGKSVFPTNQPPLRTWLRWIYRNIPRPDRLKNVDIAKAFDTIKSKMKE